MEKIKFLKILSETQSDMDYPYGSCQYETVRIGYLAAKAAGILNIKCLFEEDCILQNLTEKGKKDVILANTKVNILNGILSTKDTAHQEEQLVRVKEAVRTGEIQGTMETADFFDAPEDAQDMQDMLDIPDYQALLVWMQESAWDLWSAEMAVCWPQLEKEETPEVGDGPLLNAMAWEEGYAVGIAMVLMEHLMETEFDWGSWDT